MMAIVVAGRSDANTDFNGKIGVFRCREWQIAMRNSKYKTAGWAYEVDVTVTAEIFQQLMITEVIPAIRRAMSAYKEVTIQMDNATPHVGENTVEKITLAVNASRERPHITIVLQPSNSP